jgi:hypothetical protein
VKLLNRLLVISKILLAANKDDGQALAEVQDFGDPLEKSQNNKRSGKAVVPDGSVTFS